MRSSRLAGAVVATVLIFLSFVACPAAAAQKYLGGVVDYAGVLLPGDVNRLQSAAGSLAPRIETDLFVVTVDDRDPFLC